MNIKIRQLEAFVTVSRFSQFTLAAKSLHISQPALSMLVRELETELNTTLFDRTPKGVQLTAEGAEFFAVAERTLADLKTAVDNVQGLVALKHGRVAVACSTVTAAVILPQIISSFTRQYPDIQVAILDSVEQNLANRVKTGEADLAIATRIAPDAQLDQINITEDKLSLFARKDNPLLGSAEINWADLADQSHIMLPKDNSLRMMIENIAGRMDLFFKISYEVNFASTILALISAGRGVSILPGNSAHLHKSDQIVTRELTAPSVARHICIFKPRGRSMSPAAQAFINFASQWFQSDP